MINDLKLHKKMSFIDVAFDILTSLVLVGGAWAVEFVVDALFPGNMPWVSMLILRLRDFATLLWTVAITARYLKFAYVELNDALYTIARSWLWRKGQPFVTYGVQNVTLEWMKLSQIIQKLSLLMMIIILSITTFTISHNLVDLLLPPLFWAGALALNRFPLYSRQHKRKPTVTYWLLIILLFFSLWLVMLSGTAPPLLEPGGSEAVWLTSPASQFRVLLLLTIFYLILQQLYRRSGHQWIGLLRENWQGILNAIGRRFWVQRLQHVGFDQQPI